MKSAWLIVYNVDMPWTLQALHQDVDYHDDPTQFVDMRNDVFCYKQCTLAFLCVWILMVDVTSVARDKPRHAICFLRCGTYCEYKSLRLNCPCRFVQVQIDGVIMIHQIYTCTSRYVDQWMGVICGFKCKYAHRLLQSIGARRFHDALLVR